MIKITNKQNCSGCHACASVCPKNCISMQRDEEGFLYPSVNENNCIKCGLCVRSCPILTPKESKKQESDIYACGAYSKRREIRKNSSSGGIFTLVAEQVINKGGIVFGASFDADFSVFHKSATTTNELAQFRGSKYVQSTIGNTYNEAKEHLDSGKLVLFTGTPCQIAGLYSYLNKEYDNLITQDIICHGVPSPMVWQEHLKAIEKQKSEQIESICFRDKSTGWTTYSFTSIFKNGRAYTTRDSQYMKAFLSNLCLRPSCYECAFKTKVRQSDITLADFWGIDNIMPEMNDEKGTSLILINSPKGKELFDAIKNDITYKETEMDEAIKYNSSAIKSASLPKNRNSFIVDVRNKGFEKASKKHLKTPFLIRLKRKIKSLLK